MGIAIGDLDWEFGIATRDWGFRIRDLGLEFLELEWGLGLAYLIGCEVTELRKRYQLNLTLFLEYYNLD